MVTGQQALHRRLIPKASGEGRALVVFDADDTLWFTEPLYDTARDACRSIVEGAGFDGDAWERLERIMDVDNVARFGLSKERFPTSCVEAFTDLTEGMARSTTIEAVRTTANQVFSQVAPLAKGVPEALEHLADGFRLVLLTQGDPSVQEHRLRDADLGSVFSRIVILEQKAIDSFEDVLYEDGRSSRLTWSVGNSLASDINPALQLDMNAVWIPTHVWEHERRETLPRPGRLFEVSDLVEATKLLFALA